MYSCLILKKNLRSVLSIILAILHPLISPIINEKAIFVYLVLKGEVEGEVFNAVTVVDLHFRGILICLKVFDDVRKPD